MRMARYSDLPIGMCTCRRHQCTPHDRLSECSSAPSGGVRENKMGIFSKVHSLSDYIETNTVDLTSPPHACHSRRRPREESMYVRAPNLPTRHHPYRPPMSRPRGGSSRSRRTGSETRTHTSWRRRREIPRGNIRTRGCTAKPVRQQPPRDR
ncbi:hypothetical protein FKP32DRAFT_1324091 [Trametes sanguinea]|nr:hypothetical protein FKP32DRAFT_1324091 [Trametes sanguinea]